MGYVERRRGEWDRAIALFEEAVRYDPRSAPRALDLGDTYLSTRRYADAERHLDRAIQLAPDWADPYAYKAMLYLIWRGDRAAARAAVALASPGERGAALALLVRISAHHSPPTAPSRPAVAAIGPGRSGR
jgi:tetratricopeptide (TPR) repeat protein